MQSLKNNNTSPGPLKNNNTSPGPYRNISDMSSEVTCSSSGEVNTISVNQRPGWQNPCFFFFILHLPDIIFLSNTFLSNENL